MPFQFRTLEENDPNVFLDVTEILLKILENILKSPNNPKYRKLRLANETVSSKLIPAIGAMECLFYVGFEEADDFLILPQKVCLTKIKQIREELFLSRFNFVKKNGARKQLSIMNSFFEEIKVLSKRVLSYEDENLQSLARSKMPLKEFEEKLKETSTEDFSEFDHEFGLLVKMMSWFKNEFFHWMDSPVCKNCNCSSTFLSHSENPLNLVGTNRVEIYHCNSCNARLLFPRYNDPAILLNTRIGRCGEWANCFTLLCRTLGYETRYVLDKTDHVWTEVYSKSLQRWIHCDPCEGAIDTPLMYEKGWNKKLSYIIAFSNEEIQDVTWRYTSQFVEACNRRVLCSETNLLSLILHLSEQLQSSSPENRKKYLKQRRLLECAEFLTPPQSDQEYAGRGSGSLQWRLSRGESNEKAYGYVWKPNETEIECRRFTLRYFTYKNEYHRLGTNEKIRNWESGAYEYESVFRKVEYDWKICYLCRAECSNSGSIKWKFSTSRSGVVIDDVRIRYQTVIFHGATARLILCNDETCIPLNSNDTILKTDSFKGSKELTLTAVLSGGIGKESWQHAQLFRQTLGSDEYLFEIMITLEKC